MGAGAVPGRDPPVRAETVHESERTRITRLFFAGRTVIRKEPLGPDAEGRVRHAASMLERLRGVAGVAQLAELAANGVRASFLDPAAKEALLAEIAAVPLP